MYNKLEEEEQISGIQGARTIATGSEFFSDEELARLKKKKIIKWSIIGALLVILLALAIVLPILLTRKNEHSHSYYNPYNLDPKDIQTNAANISGIIRGPSKFHQELHSHAFKQLVSKLKDDHPMKKGVDSMKIPEGANNKFVSNLKFTFDQPQWRVSRLIITDNDNPRFSIPENIVSSPKGNLDMRLDMTGFKLNKDSTFGFSFSDPLIPDNTYVDTKDCSLVFMDKFIQMDFNLPSQRIFGFGERIHEFRLGEGAWNMWASDQQSPYDDGSGRKGVYGVHPFLLVQGKHSDDFFGMYFRNGNAMTPIITYNDDGTSKLTFITIGGQIEILFFIHGSAKDVIQKYQEFMGAKPKLPPFWALGWMQASWRWSNQQMVQDVVDSYKQQGFPLDAVYLDIPYMNKYIDFTVDKQKFPSLDAFANNLHKNNQHIIPIIDAGISAEDLNNKYYQMGNKDNIFIKSAIHQSEKYNNNLINQVWPGTSVYVDWFNEKCVNMWYTGLTDLYNDFHYDGIWLDMNEPSGFKYGEMDPASHYSVINLEILLNAENSNEKNLSWYSTFNQDNESTYYLPFVPDWSNYKSYDYMTISLNATNPSLNTTQYNLHNFYGHMMSRRTSEYFQNLSDSDPRKDKRHFIVGRSTFTGTGKYASHWLGDNHRTYAFMNYSIAGIMNFNMFGIPHVGADVCGFFGNARNDKLCSRWAQLATFYPFARFHYEIYSPPNEPYHMEEPYKSIGKKTMFDRYQYMRQLYTCFFEMTQWGGSCFDPLFFHFPTDHNVYDEIESSFIFANILKVTPVLTDTNDNFVPSYFPGVNGKWASLNQLGQNFNSSTKYNLNTTGQSVNVHLMPGKILAFQNNSNQTIDSIHKLINAPISLIVNLDDNNAAQGSLFLDQGESISELESKNYEYYTITAAQKSIQVQIQDGNRGTQNGYNLDSVKILNADSLQKNNVACYLSISDNLSPVQLNIEYLGEEKALLLTSLAKPIKFSEIHSIHFASDNELNICSGEHFKYRIDNDTVPDLTNKTSQQVNLKHIGNALPDITVTFRIMSGNILNVKWTWKDKSSTGKKPYAVPDEYITTENAQLEGDLSKFVKITSNPFKVQFLYDDDSQSEFFGLDGMIYDDYLNWIRVHAITEANDKFRGIFGLGERANLDFFYKDGVYSMWSKDIPTPIDYGKLPASNIYGSHPYFMYKHKSNSWVGVLYKLAAAQDWWIQNNQKVGRVDIQTVAVGGIADIYLLMGSTPEKITEKYYTLVGNPVLIPQWALGWSQCRYGYRDLAAIQTVVEKYQKGNFPLDMMWSDIDYMQNYRNFIYDSEIAYKGLPEFVTQLHNMNMRYVLILDAGISARPLPEDDYPQYVDGLNKGVYMTINNNEPFIGQVWPNDAAFPDFFNPVAIQWWQDNLDSMHKLIGFDGLWLDMNEASNFCVGACYKKQAVKNSVKKMLKYVPTGRDLEVQSMPLDTKHHDGNISLDTHSLYGIQEVKITHEWFQNNRKTRTFIIERSSFTGMGKYGSRWLGDNWADDYYMKVSVSGIMLSNMFGIPLSGADICGFLNDTTEDLCTKWHFVGAFYPFSRNHNGATLAQEPYVWNETAQGHMRDAIRIKYSLIRYYYTNLFDISIKGKGTLYKPMFFEFPEDILATNDIEGNVMLGSALKLSINSWDLSLSTFKFYFPKGIWCRIAGNTKGENCFQSSGEYKSYPSGLSDYQLHLREGYIIPLQNTTIKNFSTSKDLQQWPVEFHVLGSPSTTGNGWTASGRYINDDGENLNLNGTVNSYNLQTQFDGKDTIQVTIQMEQEATSFLTSPYCYEVNKNDRLSSISFYNAQKTNINSKFDVTVTMKDGSSKNYQATYEAENDRLLFQLGEADTQCLSAIQLISLTRLK